MDAGLRAGREPFVRTPELAPVPGLQNMCVNAHHRELTVWTPYVCVLTVGAARSTAEQKMMGKVTVPSENIYMMWTARAPS